MVIAKFIGEDGSMGFKHGRAYQLQSKISPTPRQWRWLKGVKAWMEIESTEGFVCAYRSLETFLENWEIIDIESE